MKTRTALSSAASTLKPRDRYTKRSAQDLHKQRTNGSFCYNLACSGLNLQTINILYLEGRDMGTTAHLKQLNIPESKVHIPNINAAVSRVIARALPRADVQHCAVSTMLQQLCGDSTAATRTELGAAYLDYCGTVRGSAGTCPIEDFEALLAVAAPRCLVAWTFNRRGTKASHKETELEDFIAECRALCAQRGTVMRQLNGAYSYGNMTYMNFMLDTAQVPPLPKPHSLFPSESTTPAQLSASKKLWQVEKIVDFQIYKGIEQVKVQWQGYEVGDWEPVDWFMNQITDTGLHKQCRDLIKAYYKQLHVVQQEQQHQ